jgi:hypothetical protein
MRNAINNNPIVQVALLGGLGLLVAVLFMSNMNRGSAPAEDAAAAPAATEASAAPAAPPAAPAAPAPAEAGAAQVPPPAGTAPFEASKGLPKELVESYEAGEIPVLVVLDEKGFDDRAFVIQSLFAKYPEGTAIFFADTGDGSKYTPEKKIDSIPVANPDRFESHPIARYSRIAEGIALDRTPALIVLHPLDKPLEKGETAPMPQASVTYGYRGKDSITQAIEDALYEGGVRGYDPG